jgi:hypothetical protein
LRSWENCVNHPMSPISASRMAATVALQFDRSYEHGAVSVNNHTQLRDQRE